MACMETSSTLIHDIRIQFHLIHGAVQVIHAQAGDTPIMAGELDVTQLVRMIQDACTRTTTMLNTALPGRKNCELVSLDELVEDIIQDVRMIDLGFGYTIVLTKKCHPQLRLDRTRVERIISNILTNALLHTPRNTTIRVQLKEKDRNVLIAIGDEGQGLSRLQDSILTAPLPFLPGTEDMHGLRSIRELAEEIGARISVERMPLGQQIVLHLPMEAE